MGTDDGARRRQTAGPAAGLQLRPFLASLCVMLALVALCAHVACRVGGGEGRTQARGAADAMRDVAFVERRGDAEGDDSTRVEAEHHQQQQQLRGQGEEEEEEEEEGGLFSARQREAAVLHYPPFEKEGDVEGQGKEGNVDDDVKREAQAIGTGEEPGEEGGDGGGGDGVSALWSGLGGGGGEGNGILDAIGRLFRPHAEDLFAWGDTREGDLLEEADGGQSHLLETEMEMQQPRQPLEEELETETQAERQQLMARVMFAHNQMVDSVLDRAADRRAAVNVKRQRAMEEQLQHNAMARGMQPPGGGGGGRNGEGRQKSAVELDLERRLARQSQIANELIRRAQAKPPSERRGRWITPTLPEDVFTVPKEGIVTSSAYAASHGSDAVLFPRLFGRLGNLMFEYITVWPLSRILNASVIFVAKKSTPNIFETMKQSRQCFPNVRRLAKGITGKDEFGDRPWFLQPVYEDLAANPDLLGEIPSLHFEEPPVAGMIEYMRQRRDVLRKNRASDAGAEGSAASAPAAMPQPPPFLRMRMPQYMTISGYFQDIKALRAYTREDIRNFFNMQHNDPFCCHATRRPGPDDIVIHVRGFNIELAAERQVVRTRYADASPAFFDRAISYIRNKHGMPPDSTVWVVSPYDAARDATVAHLVSNHSAQQVSGNPMQDFCFMTRARKLVISPSTFSWWAAVIASTDAVYAAVTANHRFAQFAKDHSLDDWVFLQLTVGRDEKAHPSARQREQTAAEVLQNARSG